MAATPGRRRGLTHDNGNPGCPGGAGPGLTHNDRNPERCCAARDAMTEHVERSCAVHAVVRISRCSSGDSDCGRNARVTPGTKLRNTRHTTEPRPDCHGHAETPCPTTPRLTRARRTNARLPQKAAGNAAACNNSLAINKLRGCQSPTLANISRCDSRCKQKPQPPAGISSSLPFRLRERSEAPISRRRPEASSSLRAPTQSRAAST